MQECWLRPNRRAIATGLVVPALAIAAGVALMVLSTNRGQMGFYFWTGATLITLGIGGGLGALLLLNQPRLAYAKSCLMVFLGTPRPISVPIEIVECFFLGHGPSLLPASGGKEAETQTIVVRLAESAAEWKHRDVKPALGHWCDGYIVIRGTWCEPISADLVLRLNARLVEAHRQVRKLREVEAT